MPLYFFDNVFGLDLSLETAQGVLYRFALLQFYVCQLKIHLQIHRKFTAVFTKGSGYLDAPANTSQAHDVLRLARTGAQTTFGLSDRQSVPRGHRR